MRMHILKIVVVLIVAGSGDARPQNDGGTQVSVAGPEVAEGISGGWKPIERMDAKQLPESSTPPNDTQRHLKDLQYIDQSLRTVATQLLNVTNPEDIPKAAEKADNNKSTDQKVEEKGDVFLIKEVNSEISNLESMGVSFGRPVNSKFGYFETSHPGQAMAMTEEELEREMSSTRVMTAYKNQPTTTGGISTWILLNPPSTTSKTIKNTEKIMQPVETEVRITVKPASTGTISEVTKNEQKVVEKVASSATLVHKVATTGTKKPVISVTRKPATTTIKPDKTTQNLAQKVTLQNATPKIPRTTTVGTVEAEESIVSLSTTKKAQVRTTPKPTISSKGGLSTTRRPGQPNKIKPPATKRPTARPELVRHENVSTAKIEKVTFKPVQIISSPKIKPDATERPMFITKIKASVVMDTQKTTLATTTVDTQKIATASSTTSKPDISESMVEVPVKSKPGGTKINNVLKVQLKKPVSDETTSIEIEPIKVNAPILKIEKVQKDTTDDFAEEIADKVADDLNNSRIDLKFDFNPELTKISVETSTEDSSSTTTSTTQASSTTKRRSSSKRKKNKTRRRKPSTTTSSTTPGTTVRTAASSLALTNDQPTESVLSLDNAIQESKIAPESKITVNATKTKKKPIEKPIGTQIYNFLSREVMPSFGVMSLVGLGLGLASYFLYPFSGAITRRNYEVEPNYKYNLEEYGGNYGQSEEEVLSKVFQGMTNNDGKHQGVKDFDNNYYHYQHYDGAYDTQTTRRTDQKFSGASSSPMYRPVENTGSALKYRNTDFRYPDAQTTPNYYIDRQKHAEFVVGQDISVPGNRQFVVGSVPKEYPPYDEKIPSLTTISKKGVNGHESTESVQPQYQPDIVQTYNIQSNSMNSQNYARPEVQTLRSDEGYEEIEITPTAVAVEHGPRALKIRRSIVDSLLPRRTKRSIGSRVKRDSVIQVIPSRRELAEEEQEEDLSNEILDIVDSVLPGTDKKENNEVEDLEGQRRKHQEETKTHLKRIAMRTSSTSKRSEHTETATSSMEGTSNTANNKDNEVVTEEKQTESAESTTTGSSTTDKVSAQTSSSTDGMTKNHEQPTLGSLDDVMTTQKPEEGFSIFSFVKKVAEIKFRLGLTLLKHASEGFARYLGHVQKRLNGEE